MTYLRLAVWCLLFTVVALVLTIAHAVPPIGGLAAALGGLVFAVIFGAVDLYLARVAEDELAVTIELEERRRARELWHP